MGLAVFLVILGHLQSGCVFSVMENLALIIGVVLPVCCMMSVYQAALVWTEGLLWLVHTLVIASSLWSFER